MATAYRRFTMRRRLPYPIKAFTVALLLCVLALRVAVPAGYMLERGSGGWPRLAVCPEAAGYVAAPHGGHHGQHRHEHKSADHPCPFAVASAAVDVAAHPHTATLAVTADTGATATPRPSSRPGLGLAAPPPPKTGPPAAA